MFSSGAPLPPKRGRPKCNRVTTRIRLEKDVFDTWMAIKDRHGFIEKSHSEFAKYLLSNSPDRLDENIERRNISSPSSGK